MAGKTAIGLFSPSAFTFASDLFGAYEAGGKGLGWDDLWDDGFPIGAVMLLLSFDTLLYFTLAWYFKAVLPTQYGSNRPWNFVFKASYWSALPRSSPFTQLHLIWMKSHLDRQRAASSSGFTLRVNVLCCMLLRNTNNSW